MSILANAFSQLRASARLLALLYVPLLVFFVAAGLVIWGKPFVSINDLTGDVTDIGHLPFYAGAISQLAILLWCAGATLCWAAYLLLMKLNAIRPETGRLLLSAALLTTYLTLDDAYLLHEKVYDRYLHIGEGSVLFAYLVMGILFVYFNRKAIMNSNYALLILALALFAASIASDAIPQQGVGVVYFFEKFTKLAGDACKLAGILTWLAYYAGYAYRQVARLVVPAKMSG